MRHSIILASILLCAGLVGQEVHAQPWITGGSVILQVSANAPAPEPITATNVATRLWWLRQNVLTKITVSTACPGQRFGLRVYATAISAGVAAPEVTLTNGMPAVNLIVNIPTGGALFGNCTLQYTAFASYSQGNSTEVGNDVHTVTYTYVAQ
jgi:hypothetical protein